jgi:uncharacterized lipoprotein YajG
VPLKALESEQCVKKYIVHSFCILSVLLAVGCSPVRLKITHDPLLRVENKKQGSILVRQFIDKRPERFFIGDIQNRFGLDIGRIFAERDVSLTILVTNYFAEALNAAGYTTIVQEPRSVPSPAPSGFDVIIEGEITVFWMSLRERIWQRIEIRTRALDPTGKMVLWSKDVKADRTNGIWWGTTDEYERVLSEALTQVLNEAAKEFASDDFYQVAHALRKS